MLGVLATIGGLAVICLALALSFYHWNVGTKAKKSVLWLLLIAGFCITGTAGIITGALGAIARALFDAVGWVTATTVGTAAPIVLLIVMGIKFLSDARGGTQSKSGMLNAYVLGSVVAIPLGAIVSLVLSALTQAASTGSEFLSQLTQKVG